MNIHNGTRRKIVEVILLNFRSNLGHKDKLELKVISKFIYLHVKT